MYYCGFFPVSKNTNIPFFSRKGFVSRHKLITLYILPCSSIMCIYFFFSKENPDLKRSRERVTTANCHCSFEYSHPAHMDGFMPTLVIMIWSLKYGLTYALHLIVPFLPINIWNKSSLDFAHNLTKLAKHRDSTLTAGINYET